jgi:hypothetical protein
MTSAAAIPAEPLPAATADPVARVPAAAARVPAGTDDLTLLRTFEPVVRFTRGEPFFPSDVHPYLAECSLWAHYPDGRDEELVPEGSLDETALAAPRTVPPATVLYLKLVGPLNLAESASALRQRAAQKRESGERFQAGIGRLARVGYLSRIMDALFSVSLLLRGRVPGATAAVAELVYKRVHSANERYVYNGRVVRDSGWVVLQYWFFYFYNSWRSGFHGVNDHESDWEQALVYLYEDDTGHLVPEWVAFASHDFHGADLRRRWDDAAELDLIGSHPVVYAGAGSHAAYFRPGEYQTDVSLPLPKRLSRFTAAVQRIWYNALGQAARAPDVSSPFRIPFVDFARGDGLAIGPGQAKEWTPVLLEPVPPWAQDFRGLWGLFARDPISGENAPAGPLFNRDGTPRGAWFDPLGFAGLDATPPPPLERHMLQRRRHEVAARQAALAAEVLDRSGELQELGAEHDALAGSPHLERPVQALAQDLRANSEALRDRRREQAQNTVLLTGIDQRLALLAADERADPPQAHIHRLARPATAAELRFNRLAEIWAAVSVSLLVLGAIFIAVFLRQLPVRDRLVAIGGLLLLFMLVDSVLRGTFVRTMSLVSVALAIIALAVLFLNFWSEALLLAIVAAGLFLLVDNVRELRGG